MKHLAILILASGFWGYCIIAQAQSTVTTSGGNASGAGGNASYTIGQMVYTIDNGSAGSVAKGVQQPFEISVVTAVQNTEGINLDCSVYPNPTRGLVKLIVLTKDFDNLGYQLYDLSGLKVLERKVDSEETEILMDNLKPSTYFLKILSGNKEIKTFKIIKN